MVTTRGCPYRCRYCAQLYVGGRYREHGVERVLEEMRRLAPDREEIYLTSSYFFEEDSQWDRPARRLVGFAPAGPS